MSRLMRALAVALALLVGLTVTGTATAVADTGDPVHVYGMVRDSSTGDPVAGLEVLAYDVDPSTNPAADPVQNAAVPDDNGTSYGFTGLLEGTTYWFVYSGSGHTSQTFAAQVVGEFGDQQLDSVYLDAKVGTLIGTVNGADGEGYGCGNVQFYPVGGDGDDYVDSVDTDRGDETGDYSIDLAVGSYKVRVEDYCDDYASQWAGGGSTFLDAATYTVDAGVVTSVATVQLDDGASVSGVVRKGSPAGPLAKVVVSLVQDGAGEEDEGRDQVVTTSNGSYSFDRVAPGTYTLDFNDPLDEYEATTRSITVVGTNDVVVPAVVLAATPVDDQGVTLRGKVVGPDKVGIAGIAVVTFNLTSDDDEPYTRSVLTKRDGSYALRLPPTSATEDGPVTAQYKVRFIDEPEEDEDFARSTYQGEWFDDVASFAKAKTITVAAGTVTANAELVKNAIVSGTITTPFGELEDSEITVDAYDSDGELAGNASVDEDGTYTVNGLAPGTYRLKASGFAYGEEGGGSLIRQYYTKKYSFSAGTAVVAGNGAVVTGRNIALSDKLSAITVPKVSGTAKKGKKLTASSGSWTLGVDTEYAYQWYRGSAKITGATKSSYTTTSSDVGKQLKVVVTASNKYDDYVPGTSSSAVTKKVVK